MQSPDLERLAERPTPGRWPRLLGERDAAEYLSIGTTSLREKGPEPRRFGKRRLYDIKDLDRWADQLGDRPLDTANPEEEARAKIRRWLEENRGNGLD